jgi:hypothetical protein
MSTEQEVAVMEEKRKRIEGIWWAGAIIWAGLVFLGQNLEILPEIGAEGEWWIWIFLGAGVWALLVNIFRAISADWPNPRTWDYIWTIIFLGVGLGGITDFEGEIIAAVALMGIGVIILLNMLLRRDERVA